MNASITIEVTNWDKHHPRRDLKRHNWFALSNRLIEDSDFFKFSAPEFKCWIYILSQCSQKMASKTDILYEHARRVCGISRRTIDATISKLQELRIVTVVTRTESVRDPNAHVRNPTATYIHTYKHNKHNKHNTGTGRDPYGVVPQISDAAAFEAGIKNNIPEVIKIFPGPKLESASIKFIARDLANGRCIDVYRDSFTNYRAFHEREKTPYKFIKTCLKFLETGEFLEWVKPPENSEGKTSMDQWFEEMAKSEKAKEGKPA